MKIILLGLLATVLAYILPGPTLIIGVGIIMFSEELGSKSEHHFMPGFIALGGFGTVLMSALVLAVRAFG